ncbi:hypothetical protein ACLH06_20085 [Enterobacter hormaechei]|uniref:hypothetical protein n=1 Tax=Enterobacter hormaechei TaxID=158836 RepID=UPI003983AC3D
MSNIDKHAVQTVADLKAGYTLGHADVEIIQQMALDAVTLLDELEAAGELNKHLELAIRRAEGCSEALRRKLEVAEERIAELSELLMKSDIEKKQPQNTLSGRPVYLGDGSDTKEKVIAGKRDIHRYESSITDRAWKGD